MTIRFETLASRVAATLLAVLLTACANFDSRVPADTQLDAAKLGATAVPHRLAARRLVDSLRRRAARCARRRRPRRQPDARRRAGAHCQGRRRRRRVARRAAAAGQRQWRCGVSALLGELHLPATARRHVADRRAGNARLQLRVRFLGQERCGAAQRVVASAERRGRRRDRTRHTDGEHRTRVFQPAAPVRAARRFAGGTHAARGHRPHHQRALHCRPRHPGRSATGGRRARHRAYRARAVRRRDRRLRAISSPRSSGQDRIAATGDQPR